MLKTVRLILNVIGWLLLGGIFIGGLYKCVGNKKDEVKPTPYTSKLRDLYDSVSKSIDTVTVDTIYDKAEGLPSKWQTGIPLHTTVSEGRYNPSVTYDDLAKLKKELLAAIERNKCECIHIVDDGTTWPQPVPMPHYPRSIMPRVDTNLYKLDIQLHSEN